MRELRKKQDEKGERSMKRKNRAKKIERIDKMWTNNKKSA